jgi:hypothetical protein
MAGIKKNNKNRKSLIAETVLKNTPKNRRKNYQQKIVQNP